MNRVFDPETAGSPGVDTIAHIIQTALTPVFLLSGIAALLNVFASRLARVSDRSHTVAAALEHAAGDAQGALEAQLRYLNRRTRLLDAAVLLGTFGGGSTCAAALLLFLGSLRNATIAGLLYLSFFLALVGTSGALLMFMLEVLFASRGLRLRQEAAVRRSKARGRRTGTSDPAAGTSSHSRDAGSSGSPASLG